MRTSSAYRVHTVVAGRGQRPERGFFAYRNDDMDLDFCLVALEQQPGLPPPLEMDGDACVEAGEPITIWQHPGGGPRVSL